MSTKSFQTPRLYFRLLDLSDAEGMHILRSEKEVMKWSLQRAPDATIQETKSWLADAISQENRMVYSVREKNHYPESEMGQGKEKSQIIGIVGVREEESEITGERRHEIGYMFVVRVWGRGYASEAVRGLTGEWAAGRLGVHLREEERARRGLCAVVARENVASMRVMEKCGFVVVGEGVDKVDGKVIVELRYAF